MKTLKPIAAVLFSLIFIALCGCMSQKNVSLMPAAEREITLSPGNEFTAKDGYDTAKLYFEKGNEEYPAEERVPLGAQFLLPRGWSVREGRYDGNGYYPDETIGGICLAARCNSKGENMFSVYDENGECVGTIGYNGLFFSEKDREEWGYDSMSAEEQARTKMMCCFALVSGNTSSAEIMGEEARLVPAGTGRTVVTRSTYSGISKEDGTKDCFTFPLAATFDGEYDFGFFIEFADGAVTEAQLEDIAESMRIGRLEG